MNGLEESEVVYHLRVYLLSDSVRVTGCENTTTLLVMMINDRCVRLWEYMVSIIVFWLLICCVMAWSLQC